MVAVGDRVSILVRNFGKAWCNAHFPKVWKTTKINGSVVGSDARKGYWEVAWDYDNQKSTHHYKAFFDPVDEIGLDDDDSAESSSESDTEHEDDAIDVLLEVRSRNQLTIKPLC